jgi:inner membrane protein COX18
MNKIIVRESILLRKCIIHSSVLHKYPTHINQLTNHVQKRNFTPGFFQSLSASKPVEILQEATIQLHDLTGMHWWSTIIVSTFLLRGCFTLPLALYQTKILAKVENLTSEMPALVKELKFETAVAQKKFNWTDTEARIMYNHSLKKQWTNLIIRDNCHPMKGAVIILFQLPLWIMQSCALRNMLYIQPDPTSLKAQLVCTEMSLGGFGWVPNLVDIDHSFILPVALGLLNLTILEVTSLFILQNVALIMITLL